MMKTTEENMRLKGSNRKMLSFPGFLFMTVLLLGALSGAQGQDLHFSQFFEAPLLRNPSLAGIFEGDFRAQMVYRNQWASVTTPYQTASLNSEYKFPVGKGNDFMTGGLQILWDRA